MQTKPSPPALAATGLTAWLLLAGPTCLALPPAMEQCLLDKLETVDDTMTVAEVRSLCLEDTLSQGEEPDTRDAPDARVGGRSALDTRIAMERTTSQNPFVLTPHKPNYILPVTYNRSVNQEPFPDEGGEIDKLEMKFQLSFKFPLTRPLLDKRARLFFAYTNRSFWQAYNRDLSSPFRETNHEPEFFATWLSDYGLFGINHRLTTLGISHQSNGRGGDRSRSWNRVYADFVFEAGNAAFSIKPWYRIPEDDKTGPLDFSGDDNPDIDDYMGYGEFRAAYRWRRHSFSLMLRNNLRGNDNRGAVELGWSFPLSSKLRGYAQYFNGYGESLIDYNAHTNRLGIGIALTDWL